MEQLSCKWEKGESKALDTHYRLGLYGTDLYIELNGNDHQKYWRAAIIKPFRPRVRFNEWPKESPRDKVVWECRWGGTGCIEEAQREAVRQARIYAKWLTFLFESTPG